MSTTKKALSLVEILVSTLIFALIMGGLANLFVATKQHILYAHSRIAAAELGRYFLDRLQMDVRQDTWANSPVGNPPPPGGDGNVIGQDNNYITQNLPAAIFPDYSGYTVLDWLEEPTLNNVTYYPVYEITSLGEGLRRVRLIVCWERISP